MRRRLAALAVVAALSTSIAAVSPGGAQAPVSPPGPTPAAPPAPSGPPGVGVPHDLAPLRPDTPRPASKVTAGLRGRVAAALDGRDLARIVVEIVHDGADGPVRAAVAAAGGEVRGEVPGSIVLAAVAPGLLEALSRTGGVALVREPVRIDVPEAAAPADADAQRGTAEVWPAPPPLGELKVRTGALEWHAAGWRGQGAKVAVVDGFDQATWDAQVATGRVTDVAPERRFCLFNGTPCNVFTGETHGNQVVEVLQSVAPDAEVHLVDVNSLSDLYAAVQWMQARGVRILSRSSAAAYDGPGNGVGPSGDLVRDAIARGILWVNSVGNNAAGGYWRGEWTDADGDGWHEFAPGSETLRVTNACNGYFFGLRWSDWGPVRTDYDLYAYNPATGTSALVAGVDQSLGAPPIEGAAVNLCPYRSADNYVYLAIRRVPGSPDADGDILELQGNNLGFNRSQSPYSAASPFRDVVDAGTLSVGAISNLTSTAVASYSSRGPLNFGAGTKPDVVAPVCLATIVSGCAAGTSFSTPVVAGAAALAWGALGATATPAPDDPARWLGSYLRSFAFDRGTPGVDDDFGAGEMQLPAPPPSAYPASRLVPTAPVRLLDTRLGARLAPRQTIRLRPGVPAGTQAVVVNVTTVEMDGEGWAQAFPAGWSFPGAHSNVNFDGPGQIVPNLAVVPLGADGHIELYTSSGGHLVVDLFGSFVASGPAADGRFRALRPFRVLDSRSCTGMAAPCAGGRMLGTAEPVAFAVAGRAEAGAPANAVPAVGEVAAVALNVTVTEASAPGFVQVIPTGGPTPPGATSNLNFTQGATVANLVIVPLGNDGSVTFYASSATHVVVDVLGYFTGPASPVSGSGLFTPLRPARLWDTRAGGGPPVGAGVPGLELAPSGLVGVPPGGAGAVLLNATATRTAGAGFAQVAPTGQAAFGAFSNLNYVRPGQTVANAAAVTLGDAGRFSVLTSAPAHLIADVLGWFAS